jgi:hypothetical protein
LKSRREANNAHWNELMVVCNHSRSCLTVEIMSCSIGDAPNSA